MPNYRRAKFQGGIYFFTAVTFGRNDFLTKPLARSILRTVWKEVQARHPFKVEAICLLPDHLHCIWRMPEGDDRYSMRWQVIKSIFSKRYKAAGGRRALENNSRKRTGEVV